MGCENQVKMYIDLTWTLRIRMKMAFLEQLEENTKTLQNVIVFDTKKLQNNHDTGNVLWYKNNDYQQEAKENGLAATVVWFRFANDSG